MEPKAKVLLAEDDAALGYIIKDSLQEEGYHVVLCSDGQTAIDRFNKNEFDICLLDVMMPYKDGLAVARKIRQQTDLIPILFLTAKSMEEDRIKGFQSGADDYISKPFDVEDMVVKVVRLVSHQSLSPDAGVRRTGRQEGQEGSRAQHWHRNCSSYGTRPLTPSLWPLTRVLAKMA